ncbi:MAG: hypothetical protein MRJ67_02710 [Nitrospirales bacterium]|nr:hypothetical protein [Nitrospira sp.]MDR4459422.1 hypothetical protein [Nitrospirales bacterium]
MTAPRAIGGCHRKLLVEPIGINGGTLSPVRGVRTMVHLPGCTQRELNTIAQRLNTRPGECLDWANRKKCSLNCGISPPVYLELDTATCIPRSLVGY